jgi:hypothetical protein
MGAPVMIVAIYAILNRNLMVVKGRVVLHFDIIK